MKPLSKSQQKAANKAARLAQMKAYWDKKFAESLLNEPGGSCGRGWRKWAKGIAHNKSAPVSKGARSSSS